MSSDRSERWSVVHWAEKHQRCLRDCSSLNTILRCSLFATTFLGAATVPCVGENGQEISTLLCAVYGQLETTTLPIRSTSGSCGEMRSGSIVWPVAQRSASLENSPSRCRQRNTFPPYPITILTYFPVSRPTLRSSEEDFGGDESDEFRPLWWLDADSLKAILSFSNPFTLGHVL
ncbi:hypothetical protein C8J56DRAFT_191838 [Mycena floridula]|nr:hypothetical protein C8J56DRAFT_191838 [Mycena floridula]